MNTILFCRVSSKDQEESGYSLPAQEKLLKEYAGKHDFKIKKVFSISESASGKKQRETFNTMMAFLQKQDIKIIICEKADRLTRNFKDMVMIDSWLEKDEERQVHLVKDSLILHKNSRSQEKLNWGIRILFAKNYIDNLSEEVKKGQKEKIAQGWLPTKAPLGYKTIGEQGHKIHVIDEKKAPFIKKMFELYATGNYSIKKLTTEMEESGLRNEGGNKVVISRVHELLRNPFYIGKNEWNRQIYPGKQETFVSKEVFERVQMYLKSKGTPKYRKHLFLLKNIVKCAECGGVLTWEIHKGNIYGHCNHYRQCSQKLWIKEPKIEEKLINVFEMLQVKNKRIADWIGKALKESHKDQIQYYSASINEATEKQKQAKNRLDKLYDDKLDNKISEDFYQRKFKQYSEELEEFSETVKNHDKATLNYYKEGVEIYELSQKIKELYLEAKEKKMLDEQRRLIMRVFGKIILYNGTISYAFTPAAEILSKLVSATNSSKTMKEANKRDIIFEPSKKAEISAQTEDFSALRPILLPG